MLCLPLLLFNLIAIQVVSGQNELLEDDKKSELSRQMTSLGSRSTSPSKPIISRSSFPAKNPHVCLAFLSCCGRTDLLNHTLAGTIRHMEEDEPSFLNYEIAWVDNGSGEEKTASIVNSFQIDHALILPKNSGLAYGMNLLINNLCTAPYILLLEEDWLYLDEVRSACRFPFFLAIFKLCLTYSLLVACGKPNARAQESHSYFHCVGRKFTSKQYKGI